MASHGFVLPLEALVEEARFESLRRHRATRAAYAAQPRVHDRELVLTLLHAPADVVARRRRLLPLVLLLHAAVVAGVIVLPLLQYDVLPLPSDGIRRAFFVEPQVIAPAPPPPPPAASASGRRVLQPRPPQVSERAFVAPVEVPRSVEPEPVSLDLGVDGGVAGGVEGGVPGGVIGGVVGGIAEPAPAVEPAPVLRIGGFLKEPRKIKHVDPSYPQIASDAGIQGLIILEAVIDETGHVVDARVLRGVPLLDAAALEAVRQWVYLPTLLNGVPRRVVLTATVNFRLRRPPGE